MYSVEGTICTDAGWNDTRILYYHLRLLYALYTRSHIDF